MTTTADADARFTNQLTFPTRWMVGYWKVITTSDAEATDFPIASASDPRASEIILHNFKS